MKVLVSGGGTGGHVTPVLAVTAALERLDPKVELVFVAQKDDHSQAIIRRQAKHLRIVEIRAGKFRRFHGLTMMQRLSNLPLVFRNMRDMVQLLIGICQAWFVMVKERPNVVFVKGGYVGLPVGIAAHLRRVPIVTHDSDALPGLTNRILSRWSEVCAVTMPESCYSVYPAHKIQRTGLPINVAFGKLAHVPQQDLRRDLGLPLNRPTVLIMPGSSGATVINQAILAVAEKLITEAKCTIVHVTGKLQFDEVSEQYRALGLDTRYLQVRPFVDNPAEYTRAADLIVTRAGSMILELAAQSCAVVSIPNPYLTGGHQLRNAELYESANAVTVISNSEIQEKPEILEAEIKRLLANSAERKKLGKNLLPFYEPNAAKNIAQIIRKIATK